MAKCKVKWAFVGQGVPDSIAFHRWILEKLGIKWENITLGVLENELPEQMVVEVEDKNQQKLLIFYCAQSSVGGLRDGHGGGSLLV